MVNSNLTHKTDSINLLYKAQRVLAIQVKWEEMCIDILNVYGPAVKAERSNFLSELQYIIEKLDNPNFVLLGDFNMYIEEKFDNVCGIAHDSAETKNFKKWVQNHQLTDAWRYFNQNKMDFTFSRPTPFVARRLDFCFVTEYLKTGLSGSRHEVFFATDHKAVAVDLNLNSFTRGPSYWKFNDSLLENEEFVKKEVFYNVATTMLTLLTFIS